MNGYEGPARLRSEESARRERLEVSGPELLSAAQGVAMIAVLLAIALEPSGAVRGALWFSEGWLVGSFLARMRP